MLELITGAELYSYVSGATGSASADDAAWAQAVADATNAAIEHELGPTVDPMPEGMAADLRVAAFAIGAERYKRREAPFGVAGYDVSGGAIRLSADDLKAGRVALERWSYAGGIGVA